MNIHLVEAIVQLIQALSHEEKTWIQERLAKEQTFTSSKVVDLNQFNGAIKLQPDLIEYQRQSRD